jgi:hypothetical protein
MLDSRGDGAGASGENGGDFGRSSPMEGGREPARVGGRSGGASLAEELDDEIPF